MSHLLTWLHLSDLHARLRDDWDAKEITEKLILDLKSLQKNYQLRPDFLFFTGDAAFGAASGETMGDQYLKVRDFLEAARNAFTPALSLRDIYLVPGNHDIDRGEVTPDQTAWLRNENRQLPEILDAMRDGKKQWHTWMDRLTNYRKFLTTYGLLHLKPEDPHLIWADAREIGGVRVGIAGFNSAWSCADKEDKAKLWCGADWQIAQVKQRMGPVAFSFALIHHPGNWFTDREDPSVMRRLRNEFPLVLHGHEHQEWVEIDSDGRLVISSGACYNSSWMPNGYSVGQIDIHHLTGRVYLRKWDNLGRGWIPRNIAGKTDDGVWPLNNIQWLSHLHSENERNEENENFSPDEYEMTGGESAEEHFTRRFCQHVIDQHDILELFGCDIPRELQRHQLSVAYVSLNLSPESEDEDSDLGTKNPQPLGEIRRDASEKDLEDASAGIEFILDDISAAAGRLMIRGPAGAGKSTLLRWCAIHSARQVLDGPPILSKAATITTNPITLEEWNRFKDENPVGIPNSWRWKIPILIRLRDCPDGKLPAANDLPRFLAKHLPSAPAEWMTGVLDAGRALVLLDGVDEVHRDQRPQLGEEIGELIRTFPHCTYVITTRPGAVERGWLDRFEFIEARVEPMSRADRDEFIEKWYRSAALELRNRPRPGEDLTQTASRLKAELTDQPELGVLASNPLLCAMICALYRERQERLPETPAELCEALVQMLLHRRERETPGLQDAHFLATWRVLQYSQKKGLLAELAWRMVRDGDSSITLDEAKDIVGDVLASTPGRTRAESPEILEALIERSGVLRPAGDDKIDFLHNTLKEYLAAGRFVEENEWSALAERADDPAWQPVILFALALAPEAFSSGIVKQLLKRVPPSTHNSVRRSGNLSKIERLALSETHARDFFLVRCRSAAKRLASELSGSIDSLTGRLFPPAYMHEVEALAQLGPRILLHGEALLEDSNWWARQDARTATRCLRLLRLVGGPKAASILESVHRLTSWSSNLTGEWMLASSELCDAKLPWPFLLRDQVWADNTRVTDLRPLAGLRSLKSLSLAFTRISDLSIVSEFSMLQTLDVSGTEVRDLTPLSELNELEVIVLWSTLISDLTPLLGLKSLKVLRVSAPNLAEERIKEFVKERPDVRIDVHPNIYLSQFSNAVARVNPD